MTAQNRRYDHSGYILRQKVELERETVWHGPAVVAPADGVGQSAPHGAGASTGGEAARIFHLAAPYTRGTGLDIGYGGPTCLPHMTGLRCGPEAASDARTAAADAGDLWMVDDDSQDFIFSSYLLNRIEAKRLPGVLKEWARTLKQGGHLVLYLPDDAPDIEKLLNRMSPICGWQQRECERRAGETSRFEVYRKTAGRSSKALWQRNPKGRKRCLVARWGAIGDCLVAASVMKGLRDQGYHVTVHTSALGEQILRNNPYIDEIAVIDNGTMRQEQYDMYFRRLGERYDKVVNLDSTFEGQMLAHEGNSAFHYPPEARRFLFDKNYQELAHHVAGVPLDMPDSFFPTADEDKWAAGGRAFMAQSEPCVVWAVTGSAVHKIYPWINVVAGWLTRDKVHVVFTGGADGAQQLEKGILQTMLEDGADGAYVHPCVGQWTIRESLTFARHTDCVVGPETGVLHGVAMTPVPKVIYLSHSSAENLTKHWVETTTLTPDITRCPCYPCHRIHDWWDTCNKDAAHGAARCATSIAPEQVYEAVTAALRGA